MFKEIVLGIHRIFYGFCVRSAALPVPRPCCRPLVKHGFGTKLFFFMAIFSPLYVCLLRDLIKKVRDARIKILPKF